MKIAAVILAGGESKRFGINKALLKFKGVPIVKMLEAEARLAGVNEVMVSTNNTDAFAQFKLRVIEDIHKGAGPLGGMHSALENSDADAILIIACDTPGITAGVIRAIMSTAWEHPEADVIFAYSPSGPHPLCSVVRRNFLPDIQSALDESEYSVNNLFAKYNHVVVKFDDEKPFININTPDDLKKWEVEVNDS